VLRPVVNDGTADDEPFFLLIPWAPGDRAGGGVRRRDSFSTPRLR
jgi:hypothetical protein